MTASLLLLGESPPPKAPPDFVPFDCQSGTNLAKFLGLKSRAEVLAHLPRANCFDVPTGVDGAAKWDDAQARTNAAILIENNFPPEPGRRVPVIVALGRRPAMALGVPITTPAMSWMRLQPLALGCHPIDVLHIPHPSGGSTALNTEAKKSDARRAMLVEVALGCPTLRPWHFRLDDPAILADLGAALCPTRPGIGVAACVLIAEVKVHHDRVTADDFIATHGRSAATLVNNARARLADIDRPLRELAACLPRWLGSGGGDPCWGFRIRDISGRTRNAERTPEIQRYPPAVIRAIYGRHVALGVAP